jgi:hypothetical protein
MNAVHLRLGVIKTTVIYVATAVAGQVADWA